MNLLKCGLTEFNGKVHSITHYRKEEYKGKPV